jgi:hypothetical protein
LDNARPAIARILRQLSCLTQLSQSGLPLVVALELAAGHTCARPLDQYAIVTAACTVSSEARHRHRPDGAQDLARLSLEKAPSSQESGTERLAARKFRKNVMEVTF